MMFSFEKEKMTALRAMMALVIVADHMALFYGIAFLRPFVELGAPIVSVFFFISGYGLQVSYAQRGRAYLHSFFSRRFWKVLAPYLIATAFFCFLLWSPEMDYWNDFLLVFTAGKPILPFSWFVLEMLFFYLAFFVAYRYFQEKWSFFVVCVMVVLLMLFTFFMHYGNAWWVCALAFPTGIFFARKEKMVYSLLENHNIRYWSSLLVLFLTFFFFYLLGKINQYYFLWTFCYVCIPLIVALVVARYPFEKLNGKVISFLAAISFEIYLYQGIAMALFRERLFIKNDALFVVLVYALTIALAFGGHLLAGLLTHKPCASSTT